MVSGDAGGMKSIQSKPKSRWDVELERRGIATVVAALASDGVGIGRGAEFRLFVPDLPNPSRGYVGDRLGQGARQPESGVRPLHLPTVAGWGGERHHRGLADALRD
jgi:hypothetical protein